MDTFIRKWNKVDQLKIYFHSYQTIDFRFSYNVDKSMFCAGNNTERMRMGRVSCVNETIVDLYAGIGYFTLPFLVHGHARHVYCCEWNPDSMEALHRNLQANHIDDDRYTLLLGDNQLVISFLCEIICSYLF
jgi:tRNA G37 N-methylase Trm5